MTTTGVPRPVADPSRRSGRALTRTGIALVVVGLGLVAYLLWELFGTTYVSHRHQHQIAQTLRDEWRGDDGSASGRVSTDAGVAGAIVRIPRFGSDYAVPVIEGTDDDALASGIGHFTGTAEAGRVGNYALAAHRITHGEPFRDLPRLRAGDRVVVETRGATYTYRVDNAGNALDLAFTDTWVLDEQPVNPAGGVAPDPDSDRLITLTTCAELFHTDRRLVVFGHLVGTQPS